MAQEQYSNSIWWVPEEHREAYNSRAAKAAVQSGGSMVSGRYGEACLKPLIFDSGIFGLPMAAIVWLKAFGLENAFKLVLAVEAEAMDQGWRHLSVRLSSERSEVLEALNSLGYKQVDTSITYCRRPAGAELLRLKGLTVGTCLSEEHGRIRELSRYAFTNSRFYADDELDQEAAHKLKERWISNNLTGRAPLNLSARIDGRFAGFISCLKSEADKEMGVPVMSRIDLIAVDENYRGKSVGKSLVMAGLRHSSESEIMAVGTQHSNMPAMRLYKSCGFVPVADEVTFHKMLSVE